MVEINGSKRGRGEGSLLALRLLENGRLAVTLSTHLHFPCFNNNDNITTPATRDVDKTVHFTP